MRRGRGRSEMMYIGMAGRDVDSPAIGGDQSLAAEAGADRRGWTSTIRTHDGKKKRRRGMKIEVRT
jgi:hypothetical protein